MQDHMQDEYNEPLWRQGISGAQMLFVAFGALVLNLVLPGGQGWRSKPVLEEPDL